MLPLAAAKGKQRTARREAWQWVSKGANAPCAWRDFPDQARGRPPRRGIVDCGAFMGEIAGETIPCRIGIKKQGNHNYLIPIMISWRSQRGSNPRFRREMAVSWATRRWDHLAEEPGFEPGKPGPEPGVMPFHHSSTENAGYPSGSGPVKRQ